MKVNTKLILDAVYPVGSIYMSVNSTSPATLFGGTWEALNSGNVLYIPTGSQSVITGNEHPNDISVEIKYKTLSGSISGAWVRFEDARMAAYDITNASAVGKGTFAFDNLWTSTAQTVSVYMWKRTA